MNKCLHNFKIIRKFANEFRREGEMTMAPVQTTLKDLRKEAVQTTPNPSYSGGE